MPAPIRPGAPKTPVTPTVDSAPPAAAKTPSAAPGDKFETNPAYAMSSVRKSTAVDAAQSIKSVFPVDLGEIPTNGRFPTGFRLDGGSLRHLWMGVRRITEQGGLPGYEVSFWLEGDAVDLFKKRMADRGAKHVNFPFFEGYPPEGHAPGKSHLLRTGKMWSPSSGQVVQLVDPGKSCVDMCIDSPEALKGMMRIRAYGDDATASKVLSDVQKKLGLGMLFAPPTEKSLENLKLARVLTNVAPEEIDKAKWRRLDAIDGAALDKAVQGLDDSQKGPLSADTGATNVQQRLKLAELLYDRSPDGFLKWAAYDHTQWQPNTPIPYQLNQALQQAGLPNSAEDYKAALQSDPPSAEVAKKLLSLFTAAKFNNAEARQLAMVPDKELKPEKLRELAKAAGVTDERLADLRFEEVYPGYFTVIDPTQAEACYEAGARYLYSTLDTNERVWQALTMGQKSSLTRMFEGMLVQGKSTNSDFGTGGAQAVFTRLVTASAVQGAKSGGYNSQYKFNDWGGTRPFKLIVNRRILGRTDWYGYNGDNFGRSTGLTKANKGERVCATINGAYSQSNELCFPVGNDPAYVDFVVTDQQWRKDELIKYLNGKGIHEFNGKPLHELIRVETSFFLHPDDDTIEEAARTAAKPAASGAGADVAEKVVKAGIQGLLTDAVKDAAWSEAKELIAPNIGKTLENQMKWQAQQNLATQLQGKLTEVAKANLPQELRDHVVGAATDAGKTKVDQCNYWNQGEIEGIAYNAGYGQLVEGLKQLDLGAMLDDGQMSEVVEHAKKASKNVYVATYNFQSQAHSKVRESLAKAATEALAASAIEEGVAAALEAAKTAVETAAQEWAKGKDGADASALDVDAMIAKSVAPSVKADVAKAVDLAIRKQIEKTSNELVQANLTKTVDEAKLEMADELVSGSVDKALADCKNGAAYEAANQMIIDLRNQAVGNAWNHWQSKQGQH